MEDATRPLVGWRSLAEALPDCVLVQRDGGFVFASEDAETLLGIEADAFVGESWDGPFDDDDRDRLVDAVATARSGGEWSGEVRTDPSNTAPERVDVTIAPAGEEAIVWVISPADDGTGAAGAAGTESDAGVPVPTETEPPADRLLDRYEFVRELFDGIDDVIYVLDAAGDVVLWNDALLEVTGYTDAEIAAMDPLDLIPPDHHDRVPGVVETIEATADQRIEVDILTADGERITHEFAGTTIEDPATGEALRCGIARDVTDRLERERELERYETILDTVDDGVYALNADLEFTYVNDALVELTETPREELLGTSVLELFPEEDEQEIAAQVRERAVEGPESGGLMEGTIQTSAGERTLETRFRLHPETEDEFKGSVGVLRDVTGIRNLQHELREEHRFLQNVVDTLEDVLYVVDEDGTFVFWNDVATERFGYTDEEFAEIHPLEFIRPPDAPALPREAFDITAMEDRHTRDLYTKDGEVIPHELRGETYLDEETGEHYRVGVARDITEQLERERELERQRDELATLDRINGLILETVQELLTTANREAVERAVCDRLAGSDLYQFAWIGEPELDGDRIVPRVVAGEDAAYLDGVTITDDDTETGRGPIGRAMRTRDVQVANVDDPTFAPWREAARERGVESVLAVPLQHEETVYGVLAVYANREDAFSDRERAAFDVLGRTIGFVFHAERSRELLFADEIVELEFSLDTAASIFGPMASDLDCEIELAGYVATDGAWTLYVEVRDADPETVRPTVATESAVERVRVLNETGHGGRLEVVVGHSDFLETVAAAGASVRSATATPDGARLVVEAPIGADVRDVVEIVTREFEDADLIARRERDREITTASRPDGILADLTDRQRTALETAYRTGYFDWPRESTAEDVADSLGVAPSTLHGHLRKAEKNVFRTLFDEI